VRACVRACVRTCCVRACTRAWRKECQRKSRTAGPEETRRPEFPARETRRIARACSTIRTSRQRRASLVGPRGVVGPCRDDVTRHTTLGRARKTASSAEAWVTREKVQRSLCCGTTKLCTVELRRMKWAKRNVTLPYFSYAFYLPLIFRYFWEGIKILLFWICIFFYTWFVYVYIFFNTENIKSRQVH